MIKTFLHSQRWTMTLYCLEIIECFSACIRAPLIHFVIQDTFIEGPGTNSSSHVDFSFYEMISQSNSCPELEIKPY